MVRGLPEGSGRCWVEGGKKGRNQDSYNSTVNKTQLIKINTNVFPSTFAPARKPVAPKEKCLAGGRGAQKGLKRAGGTLKSTEGGTVAEHPVVGAGARL